MMRAPWTRSLPVALLCLLAAAPASAQRFADRLKNVAERAVRSEVEQAVDREARRATRCVLGDNACIRAAQARGDQVDIVQPGGSGGGLSSVDPGGDHPLVHPYAGSVDRKRDFKAYDQYTRIIGPPPGGRGADDVKETLEGRVTRLYYKYPEGRSAFEVMRNYRDALVARGMRIDYEVGPQSKVRRRPADMSMFGEWRYMTGSLPYNGGTAYVMIGVDGSAGLRRTYIHVVETASMDTGMVGGGVTDAAAMASGLERDGSVTLGGLHFDTARATLRPESGAALDQAALLMRQQPQLRLLIVGHTDNTGSSSTNQALSQQRAQSVRDALVGRGIAASRLTAAGAGSSAPVADNATDSGRALNRRVELVRQ